MRIYKSDLNDDEWKIIEPLLLEHYEPYQKFHSRERPIGGRIMTVDMRDVMDGIFYIITTGCQWEYIPRDFPAKGTVYSHYCKLKECGAWDKILEITNRSVREKEGRSKEPTLGLIDSQSVKTVYSGKDRGIDGNKKIKGRKRHIVVDIIGCLLGIYVHAANISDTIAAENVMIKSIERYGSLKAFCADEGYRGTAVAAAEKLGRPMQISKKILGENEDPKKWKTIPKRWVVERNFGWYGNYRRLSKDYEKNVDNSETMVKVCAIRINLRKLSKIQV